MTYKNTSNTPESWIKPYLQHAQQAMQQRQPEKALWALAQASQIQPENIELYSLQAQILVQMGQAQKALSLFQRLKQAFTNDSQVSLTLGNLYQLNQCPAQALKAYQEAVALEPGQGEAWSNIGWLHQQQGHLNAAETAYKNALKHNPNLIFAWNNLSTLNLEQGDLIRAQKNLDHCLNLQPEYAPAYVNLALLAAAQKDYPQAHTCLHKARSLEPRLCEAWREEICLLIEQGQEKKGLELLEQAVNKLPEYAELHWLQSRLAWKSLDLTRANQAYHQAIQRAPERRFWFFQAGLESAQMHFLSSSEQQEVYLKKIKNHLQDIRKTPFAFQTILRELRYLPEMLWHLNYIDHPSLKELKMLLAACLKPPERSTPVLSVAKHLHLGILVTPGHEGIFNKLCAPLLKQVSQRQITLTLIGDHEALACVQNAKYCSLPITLLSAAHKIKELNLDLLYYWEIGSDIYNYYLPWFRLAPIQFTGWGTPQTTGLPDVDFYLSDRYTEPENAQEYYSEKLIILPELPLYLETPEKVIMTRKDLGLPEQGILYVCLQNPMKYSQEFITMLHTLMQRNPEAYVVLLQSQNPNVQSIVEHALHRLPDTQLLCLKAPLPRPNYLGILQAATLVLDTWQYSGGQSTDEALSLGSPVLTLAGKQARHRLSLGRLTQLGLQETIAQTPDEYLELALAIGLDPSKQQSLRQKLKENHPRLLMNQAAPRHFENALWNMAEQKRTQKQPT